MTLTHDELVRVVREHDAILKGGETNGRPTSGLIQVCEEGRNASVEALRIVRAHATEYRDDKRQRRGAATVIAVLALVVSLVSLGVAFRPVRAAERTGVHSHE